MATCEHLDALWYVNVVPSKSIYTDVFPGAATIGVGVTFTSSSSAVPLTHTGQGLNPYASAFAN